MGDALIGFGRTLALIGGALAVIFYYFEVRPLIRYAVWVLVAGLGALVLGAAVRLAWLGLVRRAPATREEATWRVTVSAPSRHKQVLRPLLVEFRPDLSDEEIEQLLDTPEVAVAVGLPEEHVGVLIERLAAVDASMIIRRVREQAPAA